MQSCSYNNVGNSTYYASIILKQMLMLAYCAQNYASIICKALVLACNLGRNSMLLTIFT